MPVCLPLWSGAYLPWIVHWDAKPRSEAGSAQSRSTKSFLQGWLASITILLNTIIL